MASDGAIVIKRIKKGGHGGHHGGAWKVAYADFVTAMMAFFLLMWLINTTHAGAEARHRRTISRPNPSPRPSAAPAACWAAR
ncbi:MAG: flagellar motor protein MotB [Rhizomicrobium sp.]